jgi:hypothetical protein
MTKLLNHISDAEVRFYSIGGDGYERRWSFYGLQFVRRVEDQRWSPHYIERRVTWGVAVRSFSLTCGVTENWFRTPGETKFTKEPGRA